MEFPERFADLPDYAFPRLRALLAPHPGGGETVDLTIGEPKHPFPDWLGAELAAHLSSFGKYPPNEGSAALRAAIGGWIARRYGARLDPETRIAVANGTREALFNACLAISPERKRGRTPAVLIPNPFYQVYAVAALAAGAEPVYLPATEQTGFLPDFEALDPDLLDRTTVVYLCSPANPQGAVASADYIARLLELAERHDFTVFLDECYSEIWREAPPPGGLGVAAAIGADPERVMVFNSLSKRSNVPGLRSGFMAGGPQALARLKRFRSYQSAPVPGPLQAVSARLWSDETHVEANRALYAAKYDAADRMLGNVPGYRTPQGGFFLWLPVAEGEAAAVELWTRAGVRVLPGAYLARDEARGNPGQGYVRVAMVAPAAEMERGLAAIRDVLYG